MTILRAENKNGCLHLTTSQGIMKVEPVSPDILHIVYTLRLEFKDAPSLVVLPQPRFDGWEFTETEAGITLRTKTLRLFVDRRSGAFSYFDSHETLLTKEPACGGKTLEEIDVVKSVFDPTARVEASSSVDGIRSNAVDYRRQIDRRAFHAKLEFAWADGEALYGLGSHEEGMMSLRGQHQYLYQQNMKCVVPVLVSTRGYGILMDSTSLMTFHDDAFGSYLWCDVENEMDYYFIHGPEIDRIVQNYRVLTGPAPMLPRWAFGYIQSKERYRSQEELLSIAREYRERSIPLDAVVLDWHSWPEGPWGQKSLDPGRFPDPKGMMDRLHGMHVRLMISIWPTMGQGSENHTEMNEQGCLLGNRAIYDAFQPAARELYWKQAREGLFDHGIDAWWCDCTEPFEADWKGPVKPEPQERMRINADEAKKYLDPELINAYSLQHSQGIYEGQRDATEEKRVVNLTRSAFAGQHRYSTISWSGDTSANWETLRRQIPAGLNFCVTGEPYWTLDIGAFFSGGKSKWSRWCQDPAVPAPWFLQGDYDGGCDDLGYRELYVRWFQYGAFLPMFRSHGTDTPREVWRFGKPGEPFYDALVQTIRLRYRLMPYIYSLAGMTTHRGYTMLRMLAFDFSEDEHTYDIADEFMLGPALLVCPVTQAMYYGPESTKLVEKPKTRAVYLPSGCDWYDFWTGERHAGGRTIEAEATLDRIPLFVRAGSVLPMGPVRQHTDDAPEAPLELRIYPGADGSFELYEDEGDSYRYEHGEYSFTALTWEDGTATLRVGVPSGAYKGQPDARSLRAVVVSEGHGAGLAEACCAESEIVIGRGEPVVCRI